MTQDEQKTPDESDQGAWSPQPRGYSNKGKPQRLWWAELFAIPEGIASPQEVVSWWEARRLTYNKLVFGLGIPSFILYLFFLATSGQLSPGEDAVEPMALITAPIMVPLGINICYTFGRIVELLWRKISGDKTRRSGRFLMRVGIGFTLFVILFPTIMIGIIWLWHVIVIVFRH